MRKARLEPDRPVLLRHYRALEHQQPAVWPVELVVVLLGLVLGLLLVVFLVVT